MSRCPNYPACDCEYRSTLEKVYGLLWVAGSDVGPAVLLARKTALELIDKDGQARGITAAREAVRALTASMTAPQPAQSPVSREPNPSIRSSMGGEK